MKVSNIWEKYIIVSFNGNMCPVVKIQSDELKDGRIDIRISTIGTRHHWSIHDAKIVKNFPEKHLINLHNEITEVSKSFTGERPLVYTIYDEDKSPSTWDKEIMIIAVKQGLNPNRHIKYYDNRLIPLGGLREFNLGSRKLVLTSRKQYSSDKCINYQLENGSYNPSLELHFTIKKFEKKPDVQINTSIGKLGFYFKTTLF